MAFVLGGVVELVFIRRFRQAPRLVVTVATLGITQLLIVLGILIPRWWGKNLASQRNVDHAVFYYVYGLVKLAVIVQQIYRRYKLGHTQDPRFAPLVHVVRACAQTALLAIDRNRIDAF